MKYNIWKYFSATSLALEAIDYQTFQRMIDFLLDTKSKGAVDYFRSYFMAGTNPRYVDDVEQVKLAGILTAEESPIVL